MARMFQAGLAHLNPKLDSTAGIKIINSRGVGGIARIGYVPPDPSTVVVIELADGVVIFLS